MEEKTNDDIESNIDEIFDAAVEIVHNMPKEGPLTTSNSKKLAFYALYKQAMNGTCNVSKPAFWNIIEKYKWEAWHRLGDMDRKTAKLKYVRKMQAMIDKVIEEYDVTQWMNGELWDRLEPTLRPKFRLIGRDLFQERDSKNKESVENQAWERINLEDRKAIHTTSNQPQAELTTSLILSPDEAILSDDEYTDAIEPPTFMRSTKLPLTPHSSNDFLEGEELTVSVLQKFLVQFQSNVNTLTQHFHSITTNLMKQNQIIASLLSNMPKRKSNGMSWKAIILMILWPILINFVVYMILKRRYPVK